MIDVPGWIDADRARACGLTDRMQDILVHLASGMTYAQTGQALHVTEETIRYHVKRMLLLVKARNQTEAVALAYDSGVLRTAVEREWRAQMGLVA